MEMPRAHSSQPIVTGTSVLACKYADGVMMMADTLCSYGSLARFKSINRIRKVNNTTIIGGGGEYSDFQYVNNLLDSLVTEDFCQDDGNIAGPQEIYSYVCRVMYHARSNNDPLWNELLVAGVENGKSLLGFVDMQGSNYEENVLATGYGAHLAIPLMRKHWKEDMKEDEARLLLENAMRVLVYRDCRTINKFQLARITAGGPDISAPYSIETTWDHKRFVDPHAT